MFDTHCHLNFKAFENKVDEVIENARKTGVTRFLIPGTDVESSIKAVEIAQDHEDVWAAVGIHPHHIFQTQSLKLKTQNILKDLEKLLVRPKVVAIGEVGLDKHVYEKTKYENYQVSPELIEGQKALLIEQLKLAFKYKKAIIFHNRESTSDMLELLTNNQYLLANSQCVFHCCEPDDRLLDFAIKNNIFIGVDGDVTYNKNKMEFVKKIPLDLLVLETDSPYLSPQKKFPNEPVNLPLIAEFIAKLRHVSVDLISKTSEDNSYRLFPTYV